MKLDNILVDLKEEKKRLFNDLEQKLALRNAAKAKMDEVQKSKTEDFNFLYEEFGIVSDLENKTNHISKHQYKEKNPDQAKMYSAIRKGYTALRLVIKDFQDEIIEENRKQREYYLEKEANFKKAQEDYKNIISKINDREEYLSEGRIKRAQYRENIAIHADIPEVHLNNYVVQTDKVNGDQQIYFGGENSPAGKGHGHYLVKADGTVKKIREAQPRKISA